MCEGCGLNPIVNAARLGRCDLCLSRMVAWTHHPSQGVKSSQLVLASSPDRLARLYTAEHRLGSIARHVVHSSIDKLGCSYLSRRLVGHAVYAKRSNSVTGCSLVTE